MTVKIYTTSKTQWFKDDLPYIISRINLARGVHIDEIEVETVKFDKNIPTFIDRDGAHKISWDYLRDSVFEEGYDAVCFHISKRQRDTLKLTHPDTAEKLGGAYHIDSDNVLDFMIVSDKGQAKGYNFSEFTRLFLHEFAHGCDHWTLNYPNINVHRWDYTLKQIHNIFMLYDFTRHSRLTNLLEALKQLIPLLIKKNDMNIQHPVEGFPVTYKYGVRDSAYPKTKHHIGTDWGCPRGTVINAPKNGEIVVSGYSKSLGYYCHYAYIHNKQRYVARFLHQLSAPPLKKLKQGEIIGYTGNTGFTKGKGHVHIDIWLNDVRIDLITSRNFKEMTINPEEHFSS